MRLSIVIPAHNEAGNIARLVEECFAAAPAAALGEVIVVDDGSTDSTADEVASLLQARKKLKLLRHETCCGQSAALRTGVAAASHEVIATLDGDGQNDPADIEKVLNLLGEPGGEGPALVGGIRTRRMASASRRLASRFANSVRNLVLKDDCPDTGCGLKAFHRDAFLQLPFFTSMHRYLPALMQSYGYTVAYAPVNDRPRQAGVTKYTNLGRGLVGLYDLFGVAWLRRRTVVPRLQGRKKGKVKT